MEYRRCRRVPHDISAVGIGGEWLSGKKRDEVTEDGKPTCSWWLRTPSKLTRAFTSGVYGSGLLEDGFGFPVCCNEICIRPALWMQLERPEWADEQ